MNESNFYLEKYTNHKGTPFTKIVFVDNSFRLNTEQKRILKLINKTFQWDPRIKNWVFYSRNSSSEAEIIDYLNHGITPTRLSFEISDFKLHNRKAFSPELENLNVEFISKKGLPFFTTFFYDNNRIVIKINLDHWFFNSKSDDEQELARKFAISLVLLQLSYPSSKIDNYIDKLHGIQFNMKFEYE